MDNGPATLSWGKWLRRATSRDGWSVARLARDAGFNPATIFEWIRHEDGGYVKVGDVVSCARATGDDPVEALCAAAGLAGGGTEDPEIADVRALNLHPAITDRIIETILERRERDRAARMADTQRMARFAEESTPT
jgi:hypothetical protein